METHLSQEDLTTIEKHIDHINNSLDILDPTNAIEAQEIERKAHVLRTYISILESNPKQTLRLIINN